MVSHPSRSKHTDNPARSPTPEEIRAAREAAGLTQGEAAALVYTTLRNWQQWEGNERRCHPAFFELFMIKTSSGNRGG